MQGKDYIGVGVGAMIFNEKGELLLCKRGQGAKNERGCWEVPGGGIEFGETMAEAVVREMKEELGVDIMVEHQLLAIDHLIPAENQHWVTTPFLARVKSGQTPKILEPHKCDEIGWFALDKLPSPLSITTKLNLKSYRHHLKMEGSMKVDLFAAVSLDGFIATPDGGSDWAKDDELFEETAREYGVICLGNTTFTQFEGELYPMEGVTHIVLSRKSRESKYPGVHFVRSVDEALKKAEELGFRRLLVIGGAKTNHAFAEAGLIKKLMLDKHPVKLGEGKKLFGQLKGDVPCVVKSERPYPGFVHLECEVLKDRG